MIAIALCPLESAGLHQAEDGGDSAESADVPLAEFARPQEPLRHPVNCVHQVTRTTHPGHQLCQLQLRVLLELLPRDRSNILLRENSVKSFKDFLPGMKHFSSTQCTYSYQPTKS